MAFWISQSLNALALGGLLFMLASGFSLIFGLMRVANLAHGALFMLGAYLGLAVVKAGFGFWVAAASAAVAVGLFGGVLERTLLRRLAGRTLPQVLLTLGLAFIIADACLMLWGGDPMRLPPPPELSGAVRIGDAVFPRYRLFVIGASAAVALGLWLLVERTRAGAMIRAAVDDVGMARAIGVSASTLFTAVFCLGTALAGLGGVIGGPILSVYPTLDQDMLPLALLVVILGGAGSLIGAFVGAYAIGFIYTFGQVLVPDLAYVILFLPMIAVLSVAPQGLFGRRLG
ncbi:branched-chain amino acid ABC transporter permease [Xanthobacter tagetidis]|jgi:branched-chain amino acid transport system permease protein|uniref:Branched-chain amino acid ABC transporter permease n=1 Tax=Xanthobacter tagetidis TaxID=60216 RepID=A0A3L7AFP7_9HYPH|nr:branched-chain amino acid ABC transporter permease [Xanthobacter tagetidis]MBB6306019.1 branched-chain amino acid transport system permease protein [Xanthobacter tagetidis]RLP78528.1 branched-chain amino acid ABC transporter permease [Xanthobacter tagetidis]